VRASALWGSGKRGTGSRSNALWGNGKRRTALLATLVLTLVVPLGASAVPGPKAVQAFVAPGLLSSAQSSPANKFSVIVQGKGGNQAAHAVADVLGVSLKVTRAFSSIDGVAVDLTGAQILAVASDKHVTAITQDSRVRLSGAASYEKWPFVTGVQRYWANGSSPAAPAATIAIVDSGIDATRPEFAGRIVANVNLTSLPGNSSGDGRGHGTFVAGIAAGAIQGRSGAAPAAKIVSLDVMDDKGMAKTSDVIAAADWILANKAKYGIRVANFSLHSAVANSFMYDPLDKAVERLWFDNVVVVVAAGNYGKPDGPSGVPFAPGNDPFVVTVGATDTGRSVSTFDDVAAPWSAYGYTLDGFAKPDLAAPGRYIVGPVPVTASLYTERADHVVDPGYMELSGTSFAAPMVSGVAALILGRHPEFTPDQVKGALLLGTKPLSRATGLSVGV
jgi:serine protease AprX